MIFRKEVYMAEEIIVKTLKTDNFEMDYFSFGHGKKPMLIVPGVSVCSVMLSANAIAGAYSLFADDYTVYLFDYRKNLPEDYEVEDMAKDLAEAMKALGIEGAYIMGTSHGGMMTQYLAIDFPELVSKMVLISTLSKPNSVSEKTFAEWMRLAENGDRVLLNRDINDRVYGRAFYEQYKEVFKALEESGSPEDIRKFKILATSCSRMNSYDRLDSIKAKSLAICAWEDRVLGWEASLEIARKLNCSLHIMRDFGHAIYDEYGKVKEMVYDFFKD